MTYKSAEDKREACRRWRVSNPVASLLKNAKDRARLHGVEFNITLEDVGAPPTHCPVLGIELIYPGAGLGRLPASASLDRLDNSRAISLGM